MALDLVVQAAQGKVGQPAAADVAGSEHLAAQEVAVAGRARLAPACAAANASAPTAMSGSAPSVLGWA